jgi:predicted TIM-barrel fold metal-dependent hydrolase
VVANDVTFEELQRLKSLGVLGVAWNVTYYGLDYYRDARPLLEKLVALDMFVSIQVEGDQLVAMMPLLANSGVRLLVDHCGRPTIDAGVDQARLSCAAGNGLDEARLRQALGARQVLARAFAARGCVAVRAALVDAFTLDHCLWASDWPYLRGADARRLRRGAEPRADTFSGCGRSGAKLLWDTPCALLGFES